MTKQQQQAEYISVSSQLSKQPDNSRRLPELQKVHLPGAWGIWICYLRPKLFRENYQYLLQRGIKQIR